MSIQFSCENCQKNLKVPESAAGKRGRCNQCGHLNTIPAVTSAGAAPDNAAAGELPVPKPTGSVSEAATYNVKSAVNGAVFGPADSATLKEWLNEGRITPNCQLQQTGTQAWKMASAMFPSLGAAAGAAASAPTASSPFTQFKQKAEQKTNSDELNPYSAALSPQSDAGQRSAGPRDIVPTSGDIGFSISHGWKTWTENFGLLLAVSATVVGLNYVMQFIQAAAQIGLVSVGEPWLIGTGMAVLVLLSIVVQMWLTLGFVKVICQLCRGERTEYVTLFGSASRVPWTLLFLFLMYLPLVVVGGGLFLMIGPAGLQAGAGGEEAAVAIALTVFGGIAIMFILMLIVWPIFFLLADTKLGFGQLIGKGISIGLKNFFQMIPVFFVATLAMMMGIVACGIGVIATIPAGYAMVATAYLNMSGQLKPQHNLPTAQ